MAFLARLFDTAGFPPRWECGTAWSPLLGWTHVVSDLVTFLSYTAIPLIIWFFLRKRDDIPFPRIGWCFMAFIFACGCVHLLEAIIFWEPLYRLSAVVKAVTALVSASTALVFATLMPKLLAMPGRAALADELERSNEELETFAFVVSHDLASPLGAIDGYIDLVESGSGDRLEEEDKQALRRARSAAARMRGMIDAVLDFSRVGVEPPKDIESVDPGEILSELAKLRRDGGARFELEADALPRLRTSPSYLDLVFRNLLDNALKYSEGEARVRVTGERRPGGVVLRFSDEGIGIPAEARERVFELFQRLQPRTSRSGAGIGLAMCRRVLERLGGRIRIEDRPGPGTTFVIEVPDA